MIKFLTSSVLRDIQIKMTRYYFTALTNKNKIQKITILGKYVGKLESLHTADGNPKLQSHCGNRFANP